MGFRCDDGGASGDRFDASRSGRRTPHQVASTRLSEAEVWAKYQSCPNGYYSGPRPGKARYTKDNFVWVVTPEFARKFCMPPEFVSSELKGAEAVAFRIVEDADEERCGWGGREEVCSRGKELRFEIYIRSGLLPKERDVPYYHPAQLPSAMLITESEKEFDATSAGQRSNPASAQLVRSRLRSLA